MKNYRPDIDGLRAVSVIAVILFHAGIGFPGGFVGVDVFFVISGFLITRLIVQDLDAGTFSFGRFWERRIRRIWPASIVVTAATLAAGWLILMPEDYAALGTDAVAQTLMVANIRFWRSADYFATATDTRAMLHTWSLAVEEQFYVLFPAMLWAIWRLGRRAAFVGVTVIAAISYAACQETVSQHAMAAFYLLPFRAWELLVGSIVALLPKRTEQSAFKACLLQCAGIALIALPCAMYSRATAFPGLAALPPCLGAALAIIGGEAAPNSPISKVLSSAPFRTVGLMSYSLYLWHWPMMALARYCLGHELPLPAVAAVLASTALASLLSWRFVEIPFRQGHASGRGLPPVVTGALVASLVLCATGALLRWTGGVPSRMEARVLAAGTPMPIRRDWKLDSSPGSIDADRALRIGAPHAKPCFLFWGDSHGLAISTAIDDCARKHGLSGDAVLREGVPSISGVWNPGHWAGLRKSEFDAISRSMLERIRRDRPRFVLLCSRWWQYVHDPESRMARVGADAGSEDDAAHAFAEGLAEIAAVCRSSGSELVVMLEVPAQRGPPQQRAALANLLGTVPATTGVTRSEHEMRQQRVRSVIDPLAEEGLLTMIALSEPFFDGDGTSMVGEPGRGFYCDDDHISDVGAREVVGPFLGPLFDRMAAACPGEQRPVVDH